MGMDEDPDRCAWHSGWEAPDLAGWDSTRVGPGLRRVTSRAGIPPAWGPCLRRRAPSRLETALRELGGAPAVAAGALGFRQVVQTLTAERRPPQAPLPRSESREIALPIVGPHNQEQWSSGRLDKGTGHADRPSRRGAVAGEDRNAIAAARALGAHTCDPIPEEGFMPDHHPRALHEEAPSCRRDGRVSPPLHLRSHVP
jgi:hypothetical protein